MGNRIQLVPGKPKEIIKQPLETFKEENIEEVSILKEMMDTEDIKSIIESLHNLTNDAKKPKTQILKKKINQLALGTKLFGFKKEEPKKRMSGVLGDLKVGEEFKEAGVLEEALESTKRKTMVDNLQIMIERSRKDTETSQTGSMYMWWDNKQRNWRMN